jgi:hypothetical protein
MPNYTEMRLDEQIEVLEQEQKNYRLRTAKAMMWDKAHQDLGDAEKELNKETDTLEPAWKDDPGSTFVAKARNTQTVLRRWTHNIEEAKPADLLNRINALAADALPLARKNKELFEQLWASYSKMYAMDQVPLDQRSSREEVEAPYRKPSGLLMNQIGDLYGQAATAVDKASGGGKFQGIDSPLKQTAPTGPGGPTGGGPTGTVTGGPTAGGPTGTDPAQAPNAQLTHAAIDPKTGLPIDPKTGLPIDPKTGLPVNTQQPVDPNLVSPLGASPTGASPVGSAGGPGASANPELSGGLGTAPVTAPSLSGGPSGPAPVTSLPGGGTGMPTPIVNSPIGGGGGGGGSRPPGGPGPIGGGPGGGGPGGPGIGGGGGGISGAGPIGAGGARIPGVSLGGGGGIGGGPGGATIPAAAVPFQAPPTAGPAGAAPTTPPTLAAASGASAAAGGGAGGMPPMMPPMGMGGMGGGSGGGPGSGAASRPSGSNNKNRRKEVVTPGLPMMLSGKAGQADMNAFAGRGRKQVAESDVPTTVQLIDEDLWQVEQKPAADERVAAPVRRAH